MIGVETADLYPRVTLGGSLGTAGTRRQLLSADGFGVSVGPLLSWHWPNRRVAKARIAAAGANAEATLASFDGVVLQALRQTETALSACTQELERERSLAQARGDAERAAGQAQQLYRYGRIDFLDVLSAQAALADAESALAASRAQRVDRQMDVFLSLGGGWAGGPSPLVRPAEIVFAAAAAPICS